MKNNENGREVKHNSLCVENGLSWLAMVNIIVKNGRWKIILQDRVTTTSCGPQKKCNYAVR